MSSFATTPSSLCSECSTGEVLPIYGLAVRTTELQPLFRQPLVIILSPNIKLNVLKGLSRDLHLRKKSIHVAVEGDVDPEPTLFGRELRG